MEQFQFEIDLDKVLNDFEEQENRNDIGKCPGNRKVMEISRFGTMEVLDSLESGARGCEELLLTDAILSGLNNVMDNVSMVFCESNDMKDMNKFSNVLSSAETAGTSTTDKTDFDFQKNDIIHCVSIENSKPIISRFVPVISTFVLESNNFNLHAFPKISMESPNNYNNEYFEKSSLRCLNNEPTSCVNADMLAECQHFDVTDISHMFDTSSSSESALPDDSLSEKNDGLIKDNSSLLNCDSDPNEDLKLIMKRSFDNVILEKQQNVDKSINSTDFHQLHQDKFDDPALDNLSKIEICERIIKAEHAEVEVSAKGDEYADDRNENNFSFQITKKKESDDQMKREDDDIGAYDGLQQVVLENSKILLDDMEIANNYHLNGHKECDVIMDGSLASDINSCIDISEISVYERGLEDKVEGEVIAEAVDNQESTKEKTSRQDPPGSLQFSQPQFFHAPSRCSNIDLPITELGKVSPPWLPDTSTNKCLQCEMLFSFLRRRHHCRACGLIFCNECCNVRYPLEYMNKKDGRVCCKCFVDFNRASSYLNMLSSLSIPTSQSSPNNFSESSLNNSPSTHSTANDHLLPVMIPSGVLRKRGSLKHSSESKQVMFSDGIRPGGDLTYLDEKPGRTKKKSQYKSSNSLALLKNQSTSNTILEASVSSKIDRTTSSSIAETILPPLVIYSNKDAGYALDWSVNSETSFQNATNADSDIPLTFSLNTNLIVHVKVIKKMCCIKKVLWCFSTQGMSTVGQEELVILLELNNSESSIPLDIFEAISSVYNSAKAGTLVKNLGSIILPLKSNKDASGFLFINHTIQCIKHIFLPRAPYLFGIFIKQIELTWARAFPLRLFFRLGAEFRYYPCPLFGVRDRAPVYGDVGHTIMNLLADFRNFQYSLSAVEDMVIHIEEKHTSIYIPKHKHHQMLKALSNSDDHVLALAGNFSSTADSHLVCLQNSEGSYQTQALNIQGKLRNVTGASFVVFNGALKLSSGYNAKMSIIEDGLMIQITPENMAALKQALATADDFTIDCGFSSAASTSSSSSDGVFDGKVSIIWFLDQIHKSSDIKSPIDELNLSWLEHKIIHSANIYFTSQDGYALIWTGLFYINLSSSQTLKSEIENFSVILATSCCKSLAPYISSLLPSVLSKLSVRIRVSSDQIGYEAGIDGSQLNNECLGILDSMIIPLLHSSSLATQSCDTSFELLFVIAKPINT